MEDDRASHVSAFSQSESIQSSAQHIQPLLVQGRPGKKAADADVDMHESRQPSGVKQPPTLAQPNIRVDTFIPKGPASATSQSESGKPSRNRVAHKF